MSPFETIESTHEWKDTGDGIGELEGEYVEPEDDESDPTVAAS
jgi:hypothetical protein